MSIAQERLLSFSPIAQRAPTQRDPPQHTPATPATPATPTWHALPSVGTWLLRRCDGSTLSGETPNADDGLHSSSLFPFVQTCCQAFPEIISIIQLAEDFSSFQWFSGTFAVAFAGHVQNRTATASASQTVFFESG